MSVQNPESLRDTRLLPTGDGKAHYIFDTIRNVYALYGFHQIETPAMENLSTLMGNTEKKATNCFQDFEFGRIHGATDAGRHQTNESAKLASQICEKASVTI